MTNSCVMSQSGRRKEVSKKIRMRVEPLAARGTGQQHMSDGLPLFPVGLGRGRPQKEGSCAARHVKGGPIIALLMHAIPLNGPGAVGSGWQRTRE